jgi:hypothetical protein
MSRVVVFSGPTIPSSMVSRWLPRAEQCAPASCGDIYRATERGVFAIAIIDGNTDGRYAVWHKEVLWALKQGVHVYGAAGLGAQRAAELHPYGMVGVGRIFGWYRDGVIDADDEVAVAHRCAEDWYRATSEPLVNIRATLERAAQKWVISEADASALLRAARELYYPDRNFDVLLARARDERIIAQDMLARLADSLSHFGDGRVDQMRIDAEAMLRRVAGARHDSRGGAASFEFVPTAAWQELTQRIAREDAAARPSAPPPPPRADEDQAPARPEAEAELLAAIEREDPQRAYQLIGESVARAFSLLLAEQHGLDAQPNEIDAASERFRRNYGLATEDQTKAWLARRGLDAARFARWVQEDALVSKAEGLVRRALLQQLRRVYEGRVLQDRNKRDSIV